MWTQHWFTFLSLQSFHGGEKPVSACINLFLTISVVILLEDLSDRKFLMSSKEANLAFSLSNLLHRIRFISNSQLQESLWAHDCLDEKHNEDMFNPTCQEYWGHVALLTKFRQSLCIRSYKQCAEESFLLVLRPHMELLPRVSIKLNPCSLTWPHDANCFGCLYLFKQLELLFILMSLMTWSSL